MASRTALRPYHEKRNFTRTKEPRGRLKRKTGDLFVVQKHAARRLHYDLRLELDGVLKSWAVTRGPSLSPADKRLAVRVEDHPLDYAEFEGRIPEGEYGAGSVIVWDRGRWSTDGDPHKQLAKGHLIVDLHGRKLKGRWHLVHMRGRDQRGKENWLLIKADDEYAIEQGGADLLDAAPRSIKTGRTIEDVAASDVKIRRKPARTADGPRHEAPPPPAARSRVTGSRAASLPSFIEPQLASLATKPPTGGNWVHEVKFDGYRLLARVDRGHVKLKTRSGLDWTAKFPTLKKALEALPVVAAFIDGEVVVETERGTPSFADLQADLSEGRSDRFRYYAFDLLHLDGTDLSGSPLIERKRILADMLSGHHGVLAYSEHFTGPGHVVFDHACRLGLEGIVSKLKTAPYRSGRSKSWLKMKSADSHELVIIGYVPSTTQRKVVGSLVVGHYAKDGLVYAGRVGSGFSSRVAEDLWRRLEDIRIGAPPLDKALPADSRRNVRWVKPQLVADVELRGWTTDGIARHAVFKGLRQDKEAADVVRQAPVVKVRSTPAPSVTLTHPDRVLWPDAGITKQGLADFYSEIWPWIAPHVVNRPLALVRCPGGIDEGCFFQKHAWAGIGQHIIRTSDPEGGEELLAIKDVEGLLSLVQASVLEIHVWGAKLDNIEKPDGMTFDLDPDAAVAWPDVVSAALEVRDRLIKLGLQSFVKTTGGKGLHVYAPLRPGADWAAVKQFAHAVAKGMAKDTPRKFLATASKQARSGRIFVDYLRNGRGATAVAAYSARARGGAAVSTPLAWDELGPDMRSDRFTVANLLHRLSRGSDPWKDVRKAASRLPSKRS
ncbi:MAG: DNA ligase D [Hyphomonadaceae bacterium]|jgi:bifunctional non-homologous end joining protein LigD|nr:DNA ligase D [Hyphomonadaceae bacterium]